jgi:hypothetical protein
MQIEVTIGVQKPGMVNKELVAASLPLGQVAVKVVKGGLDISDEERGDVSVIAMAWCGCAALSGNPSRKRISVWCSGPSLEHHGAAYTGLCQDGRPHSMTPSAIVFRQQSTARLATYLA